MNRVPGSFDLTKNLSFLYQESLQCALSVAVPHAALHLGLVKIVPGVRLRRESAGQHEN
jgi:hypothetical protein